jgi:hypothetical protein
MWKHLAGMEKMSLSCAEYFSTIIFQKYLMPGTLVFPVNIRRHPVLSTDKTVCLCIRYSFVSCLEKATNHTNVICQRAN